MRKLKCDWFISFIRVGRNRTHPVFQKFYHANICTSSLYEFTILHGQTSWIIRVVSYKSLHVRPALDDKLFLKNVYVIINILMCTMDKGQEDRG